MASRGHDGQDCKSLGAQTLCSRRVTCTTQVGQENVDNPPKSKRPW